MYFTVQTSVPYAFLWCSFDVPDLFLTVLEFSATSYATLFLKFPVISLYDMVITLPTNAFMIVGPKGETP